jgi:hypothetical protein
MGTSLEHQGSAPQGLPTPVEREVEREVTVQLPAPKRRRQRGGRRRSRGTSLEHSEGATQEPDFPAPLITTEQLESRFTLHRNGYTKDGSEIMCDGGPDCQCAMVGEWTRL